MRLINTSTLEIHEFLTDEKAPRFAILSHTWGDEECTLQHMTEPNVKSRARFKKIQYCCDQALRDRFSWAWVDTCCIDKTSTAELSEAINSMFRWYKLAGICYYYLSDVTSMNELEDSRWFTRGWTLQELIAPKTVMFYSADWHYMGSKGDPKLQNRLSTITGIEESVFINRFLRSNQHSKKNVSILVDGDFDVNMPLLYGEGKKSFVRLQEEIMKISDDHTLFAWGLPPAENLQSATEFVSSTDFSSFPVTELQGLLAASPADFTHSHNLHALEPMNTDMPPIIASNGVRIELDTWSGGKICFARISCTTYSHSKSYICIPLYSWRERYKARCGELVYLLGSIINEAKNPQTILIKAPTPTLTPSTISKDLKINFECKGLPRSRYTLSRVDCLPHVTYSEENSSLSLLAYPKGGSPHAVLFFEPCGIHYHPFAIIIGGIEEDNHGTWVTLVHILGEKITEQDLQEVSGTHSSFLKQSSTRSMLSSQVVDRQPHLLQHRRRSLDEDLYCWTPQEYKYFHPGITLKVDVTRHYRSRSLGMKLQVRINVVQLNLIESGVLVNISTGIGDWEEDVRISDAYGWRSRSGEYK